MYEKNLSEDFRLRLSKEDMDFLRGISEKRNMSVSACLRSILGEYRRSLQTLDVLSEALKLARAEKKELSKNGDTEPDLNDQL